MHVSAFLDSFQYGTQTYTRASAYMLDGNIAMARCGKWNFVNENEKQRQLDRVRKGKINHRFESFGVRARYSGNATGSRYETMLAEATATATAIASNTTNCSQMLYLQSVTREWYVKTDAHITSSSNYSE